MKLIQLIYHENIRILYFCKIIGYIFYIQLFTLTEISNFKISAFVFDTLCARKWRHLFWLIHGPWTKVSSLLWIHVIVLPSLKHQKPKFFQPIVTLIGKIAWGFETKENVSLCTMMSGLGQKGNFMNLLSKVVKWPK